MKELDAAIIYFPQNRLYGSKLKNCLQSELGTISTWDSNNIGNIPETKYGRKMWLYNWALKGACINLQAIELYPYLEADTFYYKTKLCLHHFTVYNLKTHNTTCYWFSEDQNCINICRAC